MISAQEVDRRANAVTQAVKEVLDETILSLPPDQQQQILATVERLMSIVRDAGDAGDVAGLLFQLNFVASQHRPYGGLFDDFPEKVLARAALIAGMPDLNAQDLPQ